MTIIENMHARGIIPRAVLYARFSSDNQREESIEAQIRAIKDYCERNKIVIIEEYCDRAKSATTDDRPEFLRMICDSRQQRFDIVIVHKLDRFSRNRYDSAYYKRELKKNGVTLVSVLEQMDDSPESIILESVLEGMSEYYSKNLAREVMKGMRESAMKCQAVGGRPPYGYSVNPESRRYEIVENEAVAVRKIFESVLNGIGYNEILSMLNRDGYKTRLGKPFGKNSLHEILRNEKYKGVYVFNRSASKNYKGTRNNHSNKTEEEIIRVEGGMPAIVNPELFDGVQAIIKKRSGNRGPHASAKEVYMLTGKIFCGECGGSYTGVRRYSGRNKLKYVCYQCSSRKRTNGVSCKNKEIRREYVEDFIFKEVAKIIFDDANIPQLVENYYKYHKSFDADAAEVLENYKHNLKALDSKIENIINAVAVSGSTALLESLETFKKERDTLRKKVADKEQQMNSCNIDTMMIELAYSHAKGIYLCGGTDANRQLINLYLDKMVVYQEHIEFYLNTLPVSILQKEVSRATDGIEDGDSLLTFMIKNDPDFIGSILEYSKKSIYYKEKKEASKSDASGYIKKQEKKADICPEKSKLSTFCGGGEGSRTPVRRCGNRTFSECSRWFKFPCVRLSAAKSAAG